MAKKQKITQKWVAFEVARTCGNRRVVNVTPDESFQALTFMGLQDKIACEGKPGTEYACSQVLVVEKEVPRDPPESP